MKYLLVMVFALFAMYAFADVTLTEKTDDSVSVSYFSNNRIAVYGDGQLINITDLKAQVIYGFNNEDKSYFKSTFKEMNDIYTAASAGSDSPEYKQFMNENQGAKQTVAVKKTGKGEYAGYPCDRYDVGIAGMPVTSQICVSPQVRQLILKELDGQALKKWLTLMDIEDTSDPVRTKLDEISDKIGYIIYEKTVDIIPGVPASASEGYTTVLQAVSTKTIDGGKFSIPKGYKQVSIQEALGGGE